MYHPKDVRVVRSPLLGDFVWVDPPEPTDVPGEVEATVEATNVIEGEFREIRPTEENGERGGWRMGDAAAMGSGVTFSAHPQSIIATVFDRILGRQSATPEFRLAQEKVFDTLERQRRRAKEVYAEWEREFDRMVHPDESDRSDVDGNQSEEA